MPDSEKTFTVRIARTKLGELIVLDSDQDCEKSQEEWFDFVYSILEGTHKCYPAFECLEGTELIPLERGVYECEVTHEVWQSNHPLDPVEYDASTYITKWRRLV